MPRIWTTFAASDRGWLLSYLHLRSPKPSVASLAAVDWALGGRDFMVVINGAMYFLLFLSPEQRGSVLVVW